MYQGNLLKYQSLIIRVVIQQQQQQHSTIHTVCLMCKWKDQGYGDCKGRIYVVAHTTHYDKNETCDDEQMLFDGGKVVCTSPLVSHSMEPLVITFTPSSNNNPTTTTTTTEQTDTTYYYLWLKVGGGNLLFIENLNVYTLVFDNIQRTIRDTYAKLSNLGVIDGKGEDDNDEDNDDDNNKNDFWGCNEHQDLVFYTKLLQQVVKLLSIPSDLSSLSASNDSVISYFRTFFADYNLPTDPSFLSSMGLVCDFFFQFLSPDYYWFCESESTSRVKLDSEDAKVIELPSFPLIPYATWEGSHADSGPKPCARIPVILGTTKSIKVSCTWQGDTGGKLFVVGKPRNKVSLEESMQYTWDGGRLIWESPNVSYQATQLEMSFTPNESEIYFLYQDPGSEDYLLQVNSLCVQLTILDCYDTISASYDMLIAKGSLDSRRTDDRSFHLRLMLAAIDFLKQRSASHTILHDFMKSNDLKVDVESLNCTSDILSSLLDFKHEEKDDDDKTEEEAASGPDELQMRMYSVM